MVLLGKQQFNKVSVVTADVTDDLFGQGDVGVSFVENPGNFFKVVTS